MTTLDTHELRITALETDSIHVHSALSSIDTRLTVLEKTVERGFQSMDKQFESLRLWLEERL